MVKIFDSILYLHLALLVEIVAGDTVQHHVHQHPDGHAEGEGLDQLCWNATLEVGDEVHYEVEEGG